jgi:hypothetical protein
MRATTSLPFSLSQPKFNFDQARERMLRSLSLAVVSSAQRIADLAGVEYGGEQDTGKGTLHIFREQVTGTSLAVWDRELSLASLEAHIRAAHVRFGVQVLA